MEDLNIHNLIQGLTAEDDSIRKMAAFKLQNVISDPSFADIFIAEGGLPKLQYLALNGTGNTLAYTFTSLSRLLELDQGWDYMSAELVERLVELLVAQPLVNILRAAMSILVVLLSHPLARSPDAPSSGFAALKPAMSKHSDFLEVLVSRLSSADHALCANALQLINSLMRDAITNDPDAEWPRFIKSLQDLGVIRSVYALMQSSGLQDLAHALLEFQSLTKAMLRRWREVPVDMEKPEHRRTLKAIYTASIPEHRGKEGNSKDGSKKHDPDKWKNLGFESDSPVGEFDEVGYLGLMDLTDYVKKNEDGFQKLLLEQSTKPANQRCPVAKASLAVTSILYDHFEVDRVENEDQGRYVALESRSNFDKVFKPLLMQWSRLHTSGLQAFLRLWAATGAETEDFSKIDELVRILIEHVVGLAQRTRDIKEVEEDLADYELHKLRELQMELLELTHEDAWGHHLRQVKEDLHREALQFMKEQRIRCLLQGSWFPLPVKTSIPTQGSAIHKAAANPRPPLWRFVRISHNRRFLHYADFDSKLTTGEHPTLDTLPSKMDLSNVSTVVSNLLSTTSPPSSTDDSTSNTLLSRGSNTYHAKTLSASHPIQPPIAAPTTTIEIYGHTSRSQSMNPSLVTSSGKDSNLKDSLLLTLHPETAELAAEWLDGLLMLIGRKPITSETNKLVEGIAKYGLRIRMLNVRFEEGRAGDGVSRREVVLPDREGVDEEFYYEIAGA